MSTSLETGFVGRVRDLERISQGLRRIDGAGVLISGPSGSGKSRLAAEAANAWAQHGRMGVSTALCRRTVHYQSARPGTREGS